MSPTTWLPPLILVEHFDQDWSRFDEAVYRRFQEDLIESLPSFQLKRFAINKTRRVDDREAIFWHLTCEGPEEPTRTPDPRRWERIGWIKPMVEEYPQTRILAWTNQRPKKRSREMEKRIVLTPKDFSYLVVLADKSTYALLVTAYWIEQSHRRRKLESEFESWKKAGAAF